MSRLPDLRYDEMTAEQQRVHDEIKAGPRGKVVGPLKVWLYSAELADRAQRLGAYVRYNSTLPAELSELAILVTARLWKADFEWHSHVDPARVAGIPDAVIEAIRSALNLPLRMRGRVLSTRSPASCTRHGRCQTEPTPTPRRSSGVRDSSIWSESSVTTRSSQ